MLYWFVVFSIKSWAFCAQVWSMENCLTQPASYSSQAYHHTYCQILKCPGADDQLSYTVITRKQTSGSSSINTCTCSEAWVPISTIIRVSAQSLLIDTSIQLIIVNKYTQLPTLLVKCLEFQNLLSWSFGLTPCAVPLVSRQCHSCVWANKLVYSWLYISPRRKTIQRRNSLSLMIIQYPKGKGWHVTRYHKLLHPWRVKAIIERRENSSKQRIHSS